MVITGNAAPQFAVSRLGEPITVHPQIFIVLVDLFLGFSLKKEEKEKNEGSLLGGPVFCILSLVSHSILMIVLKVDGSPI